MHLSFSSRQKYARANEGTVLNLQDMQPVYLFLKYLHKNKIKLKTDLTCM